MLYPDRQRAWIGQAALIAATAWVVACEGGRGVGPDPEAERIQISLIGLPGSDTIKQPGLEFALIYPIGFAPDSVYVVVDQTRRIDMPRAWLGRTEEEGGFREVPVFVPATLESGVRKFAVHVADARGRRGEASFQRTVLVPDVRYRVELIDAPHDLVEPTPTAIAANGDLVFWGRDPTSQRARAFAWFGGALRELFGPPGSIDVLALGINAGGDVVGSARASAATLAIAWRSEGTREELSCVHNRSLQSARYVSDTRRVLVDDNFRSCLVDLSNGEVTPLGLIGSTKFANSHGQAVSETRDLYGTWINTFGGLAFRNPVRRPGTGEHTGFRGRFVTLWGLSDNSAILGTQETEPFLVHVPAGGSVPTAMYLSQFVPGKAGESLNAWQFSFPASQFALSPTGVVLSWVSGMGVHLWSEGTGTRRLSLADSTWRVAGIGAINASGQIVASAEQVATGQLRIARLTPE